MDPPDPAFCTPSGSRTREVVSMSSRGSTLQTPSRSRTEDNSPSPAPLTTSSVASISARKPPDLTAKQRALILCGSSSKYRNPQMKRARLIAPVGKVDEEGRPLPSDSLKPKTLLTLEEIYEIALEGDRVKMREHGELFITTGTNAFETKTEYAWIYLRRNESGELPIPEDRLKALFPEWKMVMNPQEETLQDEELAGSVKREDDDPEDYGTVRDLRSSADLRKQVLDLQDENENLRRQVSFLRDANLEALSQLKRVQSQSNVFTGSPGSAPGKRTSEMAFGQTSDYTLRFTGQPIPNLHTVNEGMGALAPRSYIKHDQDHDNRGYESHLPHAYIKQEKTLNQNSTEDSPFHRVSRCISEDVRKRIIHALSSTDDMKNISMHSGSPSKPFPLTHSQPSARPSTPTSNIDHLCGMEDPFLSTEAQRSFQAGGMNRAASLPDYPSLDDQFQLDTQLLNELRSSQGNENAEETSRYALMQPNSTDPMDAFIDPFFMVESSQPEWPQDFIDMMNLHSSPTGLASMLAKMESPSSENSTDNAPDDGPALGGFKLSRRSLKVLNDPKLANDPIRKFAEELSNMPPGIAKKFGGFKTQRELPKRLRQLRTDKMVLTEKEVRLLLDYGPSVRALFPNYFRRRDGFVKPKWRHLMDDVDPATGEFLMPALQIYSNDPHMVPHYINRHYPEFRLRESAIRNRKPCLSKQKYEADEAEEADEDEEVEMDEEIEEDEEGLDDE